MNPLQPSDGRNEIVASEISYDLCNRYIAFLDAREKTVETYTRALRQFFLYLTEQNIAHPTRQDIIRYREWLKLDHKAATVQNYIIAVRQFFRWTEQEGLYPNVAEHIKGARIDAGYKKDYLTSRQAKEILESIERDTLQGMRDYAIIALMVTAGLRDVEVSRANVTDLGTVSDSTVLYVQGKGHDEKTDFVKVAPQVEEAIRTYLKSRPKGQGDEPLFMSVSNRNQTARMTTRSISRIVKTRFRAAGYDSSRLSAHSLRHTAATLNLRNGGTLEETQQLLRHTNINTTMIYAHQLEREKNVSESRVADVIFGSENSEL